VIGVAVARILKESQADLKISWTSFSKVGIAVAEAFSQTSEPRSLAFFVVSQNPWGSFLMKKVKLKLL